MDSQEYSPNINSNFQHLDDALSQNNYRFDHYLHLIYPNELEVKDTSDTQRSASNVASTLKSAKEADQCKIIGQTS